MGSERFPVGTRGDTTKRRLAKAGVTARRVDLRRPLEHGESDVRLTLPARPENISVVRHVLGAFAEALDLPAPIVDDMRLAITEACTNVVRHAYDDDEPGPIEIVIRPAADVLEVIVSDRGRGSGLSPDNAGPGLGLSLISALSHSVEIEQTPTAGRRLAMSFAVGAAA